MESKEIDMKRLRMILNCTLIIASVAAMLWGQNLKPQEVISKHLDAIGKKEVRDAVKTLLIAGLSEFEAKNPSVKGGGKAMVVSDSDNLYFLMTFNSKEYPFEKIGYFGDKVDLPFVNSGTRSLLGAFIAEHSKILTDGLFGGVTSLRWPFLDIEKRKPKVQSAGVKKINDRKVYALDYLPTGSGSNEFTVRLYFDSETFNHVRSEYRREIAAGQPAFGTANQIASSILLLTEDFSDFRTVDGLTLPFSYRADFVSNSNTNVFENVWSIKVARYVFNQKLAADFFTFETK